MRFEFATATRILFGHGAARGTGPIVEKMGRRVFMITGRSLERAQALIGQLKDTGMAVTHFRIPAEPTIRLALEAVETARRQSCDVVIGMGGGSVLDTGKVVAALLTNRRLGPGQCQIGRCARVCGPFGRYVPCSSWRAVCRTAANGYGNQS
jgi:alcohol dehydrogenase class IV